METTELTQEQELAVRRYEQALERLQRMASGSVLPIGARRTAERTFGQCYDQLVMLGLKPKLRAKYRVL